MSFARSVLLFVTVAAAVTFPIFFGFGLAAHSFMWMGLGFGFLAFAGALVYVQARVWTAGNETVPHDPHHTHHSHH